MDELHPRQPVGWMTHLMPRLRGARTGHFITQLLQEDAPHLTALLAWGRLAMAGPLLRDAQHRDSSSSVLLGRLPQDAAQPIRGALDSVRATAGTAGLISLRLLLYTGSRLVATLQPVCNRASSVDNRNGLLATAVAVWMLLVSTLRLLSATVTVGVGSVLGGASDAVFSALPGEVPGRAWNANARDRPAQRRHGRTSAGGAASGWAPPPLAAQEVGGEWHSGLPEHRIVGTKPTGPAVAWIVMQYSNRVHKMGMQGMQSIHPSKHIARPALGRQVHRRAATNAPSGCSWPGPRALPRQGGVTCA